MSSERRDDLRVPIELVVTQFIGDRPFRSLASDLSMTGLHACRCFEPMMRSSRVIQLEIPLPGLTDPLWASAEVVYDSINPYFHGTGVRFLSMASVHRRLLDAWIRRTVQTIRTQFALDRRAAQIRGYC
jgi:hypothetical protein